MVSRAGIVARPGDVSMALQLECGLQLHPRIYQNPPWKWLSKMPFTPEWFLPYLADAPARQPAHVQQQQQQQHQHPQKPMQQGAAQRCASSASAAPNTSGMQHIASDNTPMYQHIIREAQRCSTASATLAAPHSSAALTATAAACAAPGCLTQLPQCKQSKIPVVTCSVKPMQHMNPITTTSQQAPRVPLGAINQNQVSVALSPLHLKRAPTQRTPEATLRKRAAAYKGAAQRQRSLREVQERESDKRVQDLQANHTLELQCKEAQARQEQLQHKRELSHPQLLSKRTAAEVTGLKRSLDAAQTRIGELSQLLVQRERELAECKAQLVAAHLQIADLSAALEACQAEHDAAEYARAKLGVLFCWADD